MVSVKVHQDPWSAQPRHVVYVAIYARYSSDMQRKTSIEDQVRECREAAERNGWTVLDNCIFSDEAISGESTCGRDGLDRMLRLAAQRDCPFSGILSDDTCRFGRNLSDTLPMSDMLAYSGVFLYFVSKHLDSRDHNFRSLFIEAGRQDEQHNKGLGDKVRRGQKGRVLAGCLPSGRNFGYDNVPREDPTRKGAYGRPFVESVDLVPNPEKLVVLRAFQLFVEGRGHRGIARVLNDDSVPAPLRGSIKKPNRRWTADCVRRILRNEKYRGYHVWGKTRVVMNPRTKRKEQKAVPESEWVRQYVPSWQIVPDELWDAAQQVMARRKGPSWWKEGGLNSSPKSHEYLFSGLMRCKLCGGNFGIVGGKGDSLRYGCIAHRYKGCCRNSLTILRRSLEERLLTALEQNLLQPAVREHLEEEFRSQLRVAWDARLASAQEAHGSQASLRSRLDELSRQGANVAISIRRNGGSTLLDKELKSIDAEMQNVEALLSVAESTVGATPPTEIQIQAFLDAKFGDVVEILRGEPARVKHKLRSLVTTLTMNPVYSPDGNFYEVTGDLGLFGSPGSEATGTGVEKQGSTQRSTLSYTAPSVPFTAKLSAMTPRFPARVIAAEELLAA